MHKDPKPGKMQTIYSEKLEMKKRMCFCFKPSINPGPADNKESSILQPEFPA
jgi:hypothetical protein